MLRCYLRAEPPSSSQVVGEVEEGGRGGRCMRGVPHRVPWVVGVLDMGSRASTCCAGFALKALGAHQWGTGCGSIVPLPLHGVC